ncbi:hypothetical protein RHMOL_Rhmol05G0175700 [Rhododendron molle]|uniref:Uncharacterized protein n=1 Tax=Rhododendron molle TaxID=49168 RepID=A0ACC0NSA1_RHOML|nr:hypothetical protein RHMOL_Rhmol05G0175700 [Rhododendron molle]
MLALTTASGTANRALTKPLDTTQHLVTFNPTYDQLWAPIYGPSHPYAKDGLTQCMRNHKLGFVKYAEEYAKEEDEKRGDREGVFASTTTDDEFGSDQVLKIKFAYLLSVEIKVSEISVYDLLDMFSGSKDRVHKAIKALFVNPQKNFCVFLNDSLIYGGLGGGGDSTSHIIGKEDILRSVIWTDDGLRPTNFLHLVAETVFRSGLDWLLKLQKLDV